ncbi:MAG: hypothetical protein JW993_09550 [Sedimentisphaerales bacterium]|nr:hypothetical protein [Sedimentisphaerales bacterium]
MTDESIEQLIDEFRTARGARFAAIKDHILKTGAPAVPALVRAYRGKKIEPWTCFQLILEMGPDAYVPALEAARDESDEAIAILNAVSNHRKPLPEVIPILVDSLRSTNPTKILCCLRVIENVYPLIDVHHPDRLAQFAEATNRLLNLLRHENGYVRQRASLCLALLRPAEPDVLVTFVQMLKEKDFQRDSQEAAALIQAIGAWGPEAADAVPVLTEILRSDAFPSVKRRAGEALGLIGAASGPAVPLLEELRDSTSLRFKSQTREFKRTVDKAVRAIRKASAPSVPQKKRRGDSYLLDLIDRMGKRDDGIGTSGNSTSGKAYEEVRHLADASLIPKIAGLLEGRLNHLEFSRLMSVLASVTCNTDSEDGRRLILSLFSRPHRRRSDLDAIVAAAARCRLKDASPFVRPLMHIDKGRHVSAALEYFRATKDESAVDDVGRCLRESKSCVLLCIFALGDIGSAKAVPYLLDTIRGRNVPGKRANWEWRWYAIRALGLVKAVEAVPDLIEMLAGRKYVKHRSAIVDALCRIGDERGFVAVLATLRNVVEAKTFAESWSPGHRTLVVNALDYLLKTGRRDDPSVQKVVETLQSQTNWSRLLKEEQQFIRRFVGPPASQRPA